MCPEWPAAPQTMTSPFVCQTKGALVLAPRFTSDGVRSGRAGFDAVVRGVLLPSVLMTQHTVTSTE